ncbi:hypothetical protein RQP46_007225 [Phenoliferia psychrophenolica]
MLFSIDDVARLLDQFPFSTWGAAAITAYSYYKARLSLGDGLLFTDHLKSTQWLSLLLAFVALKTTNRALSRLVMNHGWRADKPVWSFEAGKGDVVLITGGANGIGKEMVELLSTRTNKIAVLDMAPPAYKATNVHYYKVDITDPVAIAEVAKRVRADIGHPTVLVNNAGIARGKTILNTTMDEYLLTYKVNVMGSLNICREFLPHIISINHGHIMTTASSAAYISAPQLAEYTSSKAAVLAFHEVLTAELVHRYNAPRVRTSVICPTKVATQMGNNLNQADKFIAPTLQPAWLGAKMVGIIESGLSAHLVAPGFAALVLPALRCMPAWFGWFIHKAGKSHEAVTDAGREGAIASGYVKLLEQLDEKHGMPPTS